ncbi:MAG: hypothetical protein WCG27_09685 [Pseudomonadota bacterium]
MSSYAKVKVKDGKYKVSGAFHHLEQGTPIRDENDNWKLVGVTKPRSMTYIHTYGGEAIFFESLSEGKILATRCDNPKCATKGSVYIPFRVHCPDCLVKNTTIDLTNICKETARIHTFMICERSGAFNTLDKPMRFINLEFDGACTILMSYLVVGEPVMGKRVIPVFRKTDPTYTITDLAWVVEGTQKGQLPQGFDF